MDLPPPGGRRRAQASPTLIKRMKAVSSVAEPGSETTEDEQAAENTQYDFDEKEDLKDALNRSMKAEHNATTRESRMETRAKAKPAVTTTAKYSSTETTPKLAKESKRRYKATVKTDSKAEPATYVLPSKTTQPEGESKQEPHKN